MQTEHRCGSCVGNHTFAVKLKFYSPTIAGIRFTSLTWGERRERKRERKKEEEEKEEGARQKEQTREWEIEMPYGSGWKTDGGSLEKSNLLSSGVLRNVSI